MLAVDFGSLVMMFDTFVFHSVTFFSWVTDESH